MADGTLIGNAYVNIVPEMDGFTKRLNGEIGKADTSKGGAKLGESLGESAGKSFSRSFGSALSSAGEKLSSVGSKLTTGITLPLAGAATAVGAFALSTASAAETSEIAFTTMLGSAEAAKDMMSELADFAAHTPFELSGLTTATQQLLAYGFTADDVIPMLTAVGDATAALGTGQTGIEAVTRALGQMQAKQKVSAEEMLQLTEQGIPAWEYLARAIGTDTAGAMEQVSKGAVTAQQGIDALTKGMEQDFGGMMDAQSKTISGLMSNLTDALTQPFMQLKDSDAYDALADGLERVVDAAGPFVDSLLPHMERGLEVVADVLDTAADAMESFADMSEEEQEQLLGMAAAAAAAGPALQVLGGGLQAVGKTSQGIGKVTSAASKGFGKLGDALLDLATSPATADTALGKLAGTLSTIPAPAAIAATVIGGVLVSGIVDYYNWATKADREAQVQAEAMDVLASAASISGTEMAGAAESTELLGTRIYDLGAEIQENWQSIADLGNAFEQLDLKADAQVRSLESARSSIEQYAGQSDLTTQQQGALRAAIEAVNDQCGTNYEIVRDAGGAYQVMSDGASVAKDEIYNLIDAQIQQAKVSAQTQKLESLYAEQAEQAQEYAVALAQVAEAQDAYDAALAKYGEQGSNWALDDLNEAKANLAEVETQMGATADSIEQVETSIGNAAAGMAQSFGALVTGSAGLKTFFDETGGDVEDFTLDLQNSGIALGTFAGMTDEQLLQVAASWNGTSASIVDALNQMGVQVPASAYQAMLGLNTALSEGGAQAITTALNVSGMTAQQFADAAGQYGISGAEAIQAFANALSNGASVEQAAAIAQETAAAIGEGDFVTPGSQAAADYASGISGNSGAATGAASDMAAAAKAALGGVDGYTSGAHLGAQFAAGLDSQYVAVAGAAQRISDAAAKCLVFSVPEDGPFSGAERGGERSGEHLGQNFARGLGSEAGEVGEAAESVASAAYDGLSTRLLPAFDGGGLVKGLKASSKAIADWGQSIVDAEKDAARADLGEWLTSIAEGADELARRSRNIGAMSKLFERAGVSFSRAFVDEVRDGSSEYAEHVSDMAEMTDEQLQTIVDLFDQSQVAERVVDLTDALASDEGLSKAFSDLGLDVEDVARGLAELGLDVEDVTGKIDDFASSVSDGFSRLSRFESDVTVVGYEKTLRGNIKEAKWYAEQVEKVFSQVADYAGADAFRQEVLEGGISEWGRIIQELSGSTRDKIIEVIDLYNEAAQVGVQTGTSLVSSLVPQAVDKATYESMGRQVTEGMADGIAGGTSEVTGAVAEMCAAVEQTVREEMGIHSPSRLMMGLFEHVGEGAALGIERSGREAVAAMADVSSGVSSAAAWAYPSASKYYPATVGGAGTGDRAINQTINFNQPIQTPCQVAREMRRYATYGLAGSRR